MPRRVLVFDVNETLLDLAPLDEPFRRAFGTDGVRVEWFDQMVRTMLLSSLIGRYAQFGEIFRAALATTAAKHGKTLSEADTKAILGRVRELPAHPDVRPALEELREHGFRLAALTNSALEVEEAQLRSAGLRDLLERALSADAVKRLKPAPEPYAMAAREMGVAVSDVRLIAAHDWDVAGALAAGCAAAFVARPGHVLDAHFPRPNVIGPDMSEVARQIIERDA